MISFQIEVSKYNGFTAKKKTKLLKIYVSHLEGGVGNALKTHAQASETANISLLPILGHNVSWVFTLLEALFQALHFC